MPTWTLAFAYARQFPGIQPWEVFATVPVAWWYRWIIQQRAISARQLWERPAQQRVKFDKEEKELFYWALVKEDDNGR